MNSNVFHILNGDALKDKFPKELPGSKIVLRECLVEGDVSGENPAAIFNHRAAFFESAYQIPATGYRKTSQLEIEKIIKIPEHSVVNLWFEDDLFCQVNLWFAAYLLCQNNYHYQVFIIRPNTSLQYGFSTLNSQQLQEAINKKIVVKPDELAMFRDLWVYFQKNKIHKLIELANFHHEKFPFLKPAIEAQARRFPVGKPGEPHEIVQELINKHGKDDFGLIFRKFIEKTPIYGFGDMQVKRIFDELLRNESLKRHIPRKTP